ncbi:hypothetical protein FA13DRAFT_498974 [Coprinellus micaceus]|uniref:Uncharacterized protein n=1 Tax=Coprinellus micaceus TaxID=71717 RepID=A0A4Y7TBA1_COPMI|nr:hypothetical protein FA13DRAFT_498974 [Coprinellus micaceus]
MSDVESEAGHWVLQVHRQRVFGRPEGDSYVDAACVDASKGRRTVGTGRRWGLAGALGYTRRSARSSLGCLAKALSSMRTVIQLFRYSVFEAGLEHARCRSPLQRRDDETILIPDDPTDNPLDRTNGCCFVARLSDVGIGSPPSLSSPPPIPSSPRKVCTKERSTDESDAFPEPGAAQASRASVKTEGGQDPAI